VAVGKRVPGQIVVGVEYVASVGLFDRPEESRDSSHKDEDSSHKKTLLHIELSEPACRRQQRTSECRQAAEAAFPTAKVDLVRIRAYLKAPGADAGDFFDCLKAALQA
jgi:hypothetical protein